MTTIADVVALLVDEVGDTEDGKLAAWATTVWNINADKVQITPRLQWICTKRDLIDIALGANREQTDFGGGQDLVFKASQKVASLRKMRDECESEIHTLQKTARANRVGVTAPLTVAASLTPAMFSSSTLPPAGPIGAC